MADTRLFKITYSSGKVAYGGRTKAAPAAAYSLFEGGGYRKGAVVRIEATNAEATSGWTDVTAEFMTFAEYTQEGSHG